MILLPKPSKFNGCAPFLKIGSFGLSCEQIRNYRVLLQNANWYSKSGEKIGWGDLSARDFIEISHELEEKELFITINEKDSYDVFNVLNPGIDYVAEHAIYIIARKKMYRIDKYDYSGTNKTVEIEGLQFMYLKPDKVKELIVSCGNSCK